jgi:hypothetical protein
MQTFSKQYRRKQKIQAVGKRAINYEYSNLLPVVL